MSKKAQVKKVYHYAKSDSGKKAAVGVGIAVLAIYALSRIKIGGDSITEKVGGGIGDILGGAAGGILGGAGEAVSGAAGGIGEGAGKAAKSVIWDAPARLGSGILAPIVDIGMGKGTGESWRKQGLAAIDEHGLGVVFWTNDKIARTLSPRSKPVDPSTGYKTSMGGDWLHKGRTYLTPEGQAIAVANRELWDQWSAPGDVGYLMALREGRDVSRWNTSSLTPEFKQAMNIY